MNDSTCSKNLPFPKVLHFGTVDDFENTIVNEFALFTINIGAQSTELVWILDFKQILLLLLLLFNNSSATITLIKPYNNRRVTLEIVYYGGSYSEAFHSMNIPHNHLCV